MRAPWQDRAVRWGKSALFLACVAPLGVLGFRIASGGLGANPVEEVLHFTGDWALRLLLGTLAVTPLRRLTGQGWLVRWRRMLGLFAFFYAVLHFMVYLVLDRQLDWGEIIADLGKRPYITVGFAALLFMVPLAVTSTRGWVRRLGRRWQRLHRVVYLIAVLGVLHYLWLVKADLREPLVYAAVLALLLVLRLPWPWTRSGASARRGAVSRAGPLA
jgi:methionine sulfoxide reductase heme-binding subunit